MKTNASNKIIYKDLSYRVNGCLFKVHNKLGRFGREKQYGDLLGKILRDNEIKFKREVPLPVNGIKDTRTNLADFVIEDKIILELKAVPIITKNDYYQMNRYLKASGMKLGLIVNFRNKYLKPIRVIRSDS